jgi:hypothetical protein
VVILMMDILRNTVLQAERNTGLKAKEIYVDLGYRWLN